MNYNIKDIRKWGNLKLEKFYCLDILKLDITDLIIKHPELVTSSYPLLNEYNEKTNPSYIGMKKLIEDVLNISVKDTEIYDEEKRTFRNKYNQIMKNYVKDVGLNKELESILFKGGILLAQCKTQHQKVQEFYNALLLWSIYLCKYRTEITSSDTMVTKLVTLDCKEFKDYILGELL